MKLLSVGLILSVGTMTVAGFSALEFDCTSDRTAKKCLSAKTQKETQNDPGFFGDISKSKGGLMNYSVKNCNQAKITFGDVKECSSRFCGIKNCFDQ